MIIHSTHKARAILSVSAVMFTLLFTESAIAQVQYITPTRVESSAAVLEGVAKNRGSTSFSMTGNGKAFRIGYRSDSTLTIYLVPAKASGEFRPTDYLLFTLEPTGETDGDVVVDLRASPGWTPLERTYLFTMLAPSEHAQAGFTNVEFVDASLWDILIAGMGHVFISEPYNTSTYHGLHGYSFLATSVAMLLGIGITIIAIAVALGWEKTVGMRWAINIMLIGILLYGARFGIDLLRMSSEHLASFSTEKIYDEAGSVHFIAEDIAGRDDVRTVYVCKDGTNYREKLLKYFVYPIPVLAVPPKDHKDIDVIAIMAKLEWEFVEDKTLTGNGMLNCGDVHLRVERLASFSDGSMLFRRIHAE